MLRELRRETELRENRHYHSDKSLFFGYQIFETERLLSLQFQKGEATVGREPTCLTTVTPHLMHVHLHLLRAQHVHLHLLRAQLFTRCILAYLSNDWI